MLVSNNECNIGYEGLATDIAILRIDGSL